MNRYLFNYKLIFVFIIVIAIVLRFWGLGQNPPSLSWDEVAWGYNAYSLGIDGKDEFGKFLPIKYLESFGDYKPPMYAYLDILPIKIFGLNEFTTRFPSAFFGVITVFLTYFLVKRIFYQSKNADNLALVSAFILAISPWHIMLSRAAFEANIATFFIVFSIFLFLKGVQDKGFYLIFAALTFVFSMYTFNSARIVSPLLVIVLSVVFIKRLIYFKKESFIAGLIGIVLLLPFISFMLSPQSAVRFKEVNIFSDITIAEKLNQEIKNDSNNPSAKLIHNWRFAYGREYLKHYLDNLNPNFLFVKGDINPKFSIQDVGQLYFWEFPFFILGILFLFKKRENLWWIIPVWLILGIIPAGSARETPHALRTESALPMFQILVAYGVVVCMANLKKYKNFAIFFLGFVAFSGVVYFLHNYYTHYPYNYSREWQYSYKDVVLFTKEIQKNYDVIYVTRDLERGYIYYLYYLKTDPRNFRANSTITRDVFGFVEVARFDKYHFGNISETDKSKRVLYIQNVEKIPKGVKTIKEFRTLNGNVRFIAYE